MFRWDHKNYSRSLKLVRMRTFLTTQKVLIAPLGSMRLEMSSWEWRASEKIRHIYRKFFPPETHLILKTGSQFQVTLILETWWPAHSLKTTMTLTWARKSWENLWRREYLKSKIAHKKWKRYRMTKIHI